MIVLTRLCQHPNLHTDKCILETETTGDRIWFLCTAGFYYKFVKLQGRTGTPQFRFTYSHDHFHQKNGEKKTNKNTSKKTLRRI